MRIAYVAPRFHTNQIPIVKGWMDTGDKVLFISQYVGKSEDYAVCKPIVLGYSRLFMLINRIYKIVRRNNIAKSANPENFKMHYGFPPIYKLKHLLENFMPDLVILRERSVYNIFVHSVCRKKNIPCILYNQTPLYDYELPRNDPMHRMVRALLPRKRMTPVMGNPSTGYLDVEATYIPFVMEPKISPEEKEYLKNNRIHILCVAKYEERKNILMLLRVISALSKKYDLYLTVAGEVSTEHHKSYYQEVISYVERESMQERVSLYTNIPHEKVQELYSSTDVFVLPSTGEFASVSQLEAMAYSLPVICSDTNGTRCYVEPHVNGEWFADKQEQDLLVKLESIISDTKKIVSMGQESYRLICEKYQFGGYKSKVLELWNKENE